MRAEAGSLRRSAAHPCPPRVSCGVGRFVRRRCGAARRGAEAAEAGGGETPPTSRSPGCSPPKPCSQITTAASGADAAEHAARLMTLEPRLSLEELARRCGQTQPALSLHPRALRIVPPPLSSSAAGASSSASSSSLPDSASEFSSLIGVSRAAGQRELARDLAHGDSLQGTTRRKEVNVHLYSAFTI